MNSRERVCNAVRHLPSDRVPTLYGDVSWISLSNTRTSRPEGGFLDEWGVVNIPCDGMCHGERFHPVTTIAGLVAHPFPDPLRPERWDGVLERIAVARDSWTMVVLGPAIWEQLHFLCPMEDAMAWLYEYPEEMGAVADRLVEFHLAELGRLADSGVDCVYFQDDWGLQNGLMISPALWRAFFRPRYARLFGRCRELDIATFFHSCGHILEIMPDLAEIGLDILQMQQPDCMGLDKILAVCRGRLALSIMPDIQTCLPQATAEEVRRVSAHLLEATGAGRGGMIADNYGHWPAGIPPANIAAWQETVAAWQVAAPDGNPAANGELTVVCFGDSITGPPNYAEHLHQYLKWPDLLQLMLEAQKPARTVAVINRGWAGDKTYADPGCGTPGAINRLTTDVLPLKPRIAVVLIGGNDRKSTPEDRQLTYENLTRMVASLRQNNVRALLLQYHLLTAPGHQATVWKHLPGNNDLIARVAAEQDVPLLDMAGPMAEAATRQPIPELVSPLDGVHLSPGGELVFARAVFAKLLGLGWLV